MSFGWAYVGCDDIAITSMTGPSGSILVRTGTFSVSGSDNLKLFQESTDPAAHAVELTGALKQLGNLYVTGTLRCSSDAEFGSDVNIVGNLTANSYNVVNTTVTEIQSQGSTVFGDGYGDLHQITGTLSVSGPGTEGSPPALVVSGSSLVAGNKVGIMTKTPSTTLDINGSLATNYDKLDTGTGACTITVTSSFVGVTSNNAVTVTLPEAQAAGSGRILVIKDEAGTQPRVTGTRITVSPAAGETIDDQAAYYIQGTRAALSLYSDGVDQWFVF